MAKPDLTILGNRFTIHRLQPGTDIPAAVFASAFFWVGRTDEELSIVCEASVQLEGGKESKDWACLKVLGPLDLSVTGVLAGISVVLAAAQVSIFAISTFDTDYILVKSAQLETAETVLKQSGYTVESLSLPGP